MQRAFISACVTILLASSVSAQQTSDAGKQPVPKKQAAGAASKAELNELLEGNIRAMWAAFKDKKKQAYSEYLWDDYTAVEEDSQGERNKLRVLREVDESVVYKYTLQLFKVDALGPDAALVTYENVIQFPPKSRTKFEKIFISEIWLKRHGQWKAWRYQASRVK